MKQNTGRHTMCRLESQSLFLWPIEDWVCCPGFKGSLLANHLLTPWWTTKRRLVVGEIWKENNSRRMSVVKRALSKWCCRANQVASFAANTFYNLNKYICQFIQIHFAIRTNTFCNSDKHICQFGEFFSSIGRNTFVQMVDSEVESKGSGEVIIWLLCSPRHSHDSLMRFHIATSSLSSLI